MTLWADCFRRYRNLKFEKLKNMKISFVVMLGKENLRFVTRPTLNAMCMIKIFIGRSGVVNEGCNSERLLKLGGWFGGHKMLFVGGEGKEGATTPAPLKF